MRPTGMLGPFTRVLAHLVLVLAVIAAVSTAAGAASRPRLKGAPSVRLGYGFADPSLDDARGRFARTGVAEIAIGSLTIEPLQSGIVMYETGEVQLARLSTQLGAAAETGEIDAEAWRTSLTWSTGYGYVRGRTRLLLYRTMGLGACYLDLDETRLRAEDEHPLGYFDERFTCGTNTAAGMLLQFGPVVGLQADYDRAIAFRRVLGWKWAGSELIEQLGQALLARFVDRVRDRRPMAAPILSFLLSNGLSYAAYELRKEDGHFPFDSPPPLSVDTFKMGLRFTF